MADINGNKTGGRLKGSNNKVTKDTREAFKKLVEDNTDKFQGWIDKVAETNPVKAIELITNLAEFVLPKLSRTEIQSENKEIGDEPFSINFSEDETKD